MAKPIILVVEDHPTQQKVIKLLAEEYGYDVVVVSSCQDAVEAIAENDVYSMVLMDIRLPDKDGFVCASELRELARGKKQIPIIAMTGYATASERKSVLERGMDDLLAKPFSALEFRDMINKWVSRRRKDSNVYNLKPGQRNQEGN